MGSQRPEGTLCNHAQGTLRHVPEGCPPTPPSLRSHSHCRPPCQALCEAMKKWQESRDHSGKRRRCRSSDQRCYIDFHFEQGVQSFRAFQAVNLYCSLIKLNPKVNFPPRSPPLTCLSAARAGSVKFDKRMNFLENDRRYCRMYPDNTLDASLQKEISFYQQKAKEWAEVPTACVCFFVVQKLESVFLFFHFFAFCLCYMESYTVMKT